MAVVGGSAGGFGARAGVALAVFLLAAAGAAGEDARREPEAPSRPELTQEARVAIRRGLDALARMQQSNGAWRCVVGAKLNETYQGETDADHVGVTGLAGLAFLAQGSVPGAGRYAANVEGALDFVLSCTQPDGFISNAGSRMYEHAFATLFLAEIHGMTPREDLAPKLESAVGVIVRSQNTQGGWRYLPFDEDADMSVTVCQVQALRAARNHGIAVPKETIDRAIDYIRRSQVLRVPRERWHDAGGFKYQPLEAYDHYNRITPALTGAGLTALYGTGVYEGQEVDRALEYLERPQNRLRMEGPVLPYDYFYGNYYVGQAMFQAGGVHWQEWFPRVRDEIVSTQRPDGTWLDVVGPAYATAMGCLILEIPYRYLPIFQR